MFVKEFELRWNDIDANMHVANSSYLMLFAQTRMALLEECGLSLSSMQNYKIGPVVFDEHIYYFKEVHYGPPVKVSLEVKGLSEDGMFFSFEHNLFNHKGQNCARCHMSGGWISLESRKLTGLPSDLYDALSKEEYFAEDFKILTSEDTRAHRQTPKNLDI